MGERSVLIVGAGIAGLTAAHRLAHAGWSVTLLEAAVQPGGRIKSIRPPSLSAPVELGAEFIHGENVATWPWLRQAGLSTAEVPSGHWRLAGRHWREDNSFADLLASLVARVDRAGPDLTIQHFLRASEDLTEAERWSLREYVEGFHAADPGQISAQAVAASEAAAEETEGTRQFRVEQGYGALVNWLLADLSAFPVEVHLECRAKRVRWEQGSVRIQADTPRGKTSFAGDRAIVTVPVAVWRTDELQFEPELPGFRAALMDLVPGHVTKVALHFKSRVWPVERFGFIHSPDPWLPTWWSDERGQILTGWAGGPRARELNEEKELVIRDQAVRAASFIFGVPEASLAALLEGFYWHNWSQDPLARGAYSYLRVGGQRTPPQLARAIQNTIWAAGEAFADHGQQGTVHGAIESGLRAAGDILESCPF